MAELAIDVKGLVKRFGDKTVVNGVDIRVAKGQIVGFLGPNGSGKTTTIRMICGLLTPDGGSGTCLGYDIIREAEKIKRQVGYMTQKFSLYEDLTVAENLSFIASVYAVADARRRVDAALEQLGLSARRRQLAGTMSGGWKQRLALAACMIHDPKLLLLDEPTAGVDPKARREFWDSIHELAAQGMTTLVSTHYMDEAERCHSLTYIAYGDLLATGSVADIVRSSRLSTWQVEGPPGCGARLRGLPGVEQVAAFGSVWHVSGENAELLAQSLANLPGDCGITVRPTETGLEDAFIKLMGGKKDNFQ